MPRKPGELFLPGHRGPAFDAGKYYRLADLGDCKLLAERSRPGECGRNPRHNLIRDTQITQPLYLL